MDRKLQQQEIERLIQLGDSARSGISHSVVSIKRRLDFPERIKESLQSKPTHWLLGSLVAGLAVSTLIRRKPSPALPPPPVKKRGLPLTLLGLTLTAVRPFAKVWLADQVKHYLAGRQTPPGDSRTRSQSPHQLL